MTIVKKTSQDNVINKSQVRIECLIHKQNKDYNNKNAILHLKENPMGAHKQRFAKLQLKNVVILFMPVYS